MEQPHSQKKVIFFLNNNTNIFYDFDVNSTNSFLKIFELINPDYVINCVAITSVDSSGKFCDSLNINSLPHNLVNFSKIYKFKLIHFSTDSVYHNNSTNSSENSDLYPMIYILYQKF